MTKRGLGANPLDTIVPTKGGTRPKPAPPEKKVNRSRHTLHLENEVMDRARNIAYWTPGLSLSRLTEDAIRREVKRLEKKNGGPFPERETELVGGRPLKGPR